MPATRSSATATSAASHYNLRSNRPAVGHFAGMDDEPELTAADYAAAATLVSMRSAAPAVAAVQPQPQRRSARLANRS